MLSGREIGRSIGRASRIRTICPKKGPVKEGSTIFTQDAQNPFHRCGDRAMSVHDGRGTKPLPEKEIHLNTDPEAAPEVLGSQNGKFVASVKKRAVGAAPKAAGAAKTTTALRRPPDSSRDGSKAEKLICRYCGSDDLAPSFKERRDARCRACFKKRYGSARQGKKTAGSRKAKAAK
jgi:hypothetical protein